MRKVHRLVEKVKEVFGLKRPKVPIIAIAEIDAILVEIEQMKEPRQAAVQQIRKDAKEGANKNG